MLQSPDRSPETYVFRRSSHRQGYLVGESATDLATVAHDRGKYISVISGKPQKIRYDPLRTPKSYNFSRLSIARQRENIGESSGIKGIKTVDVEGTKIPTKLPPQTYRFSTTYERAEPPGTYRNAERESKPATRDGGHIVGASLQKGRGPVRSCDCLFYLYNGYCDGHKDTVPYYNVRSFSDPRLVPFTANIAHEVTIPTVSRYDTGANLFRIGYRMI